MMADQQASILIVDDEEPIVALLTHLLSPDYRCSSARSGDEAVRLLQSQDFDIVLAEIGLPGISGLELCRYVVEKSPATAVIIISGRVETEMTIEAMHAGAFDYVAKPFDLSQVKSTVERAAKRRAA